jgi:hypothetical protein
VADAGLDALAFGGADRAFGVECLDRRLEAVAGSY